MRCPDRAHPGFAVGPERAYNGGLQVGCTGPLGVPAGAGCATEGERCSGHGWAYSGDKEAVIPEVKPRKTEASP